MPIDASNVQWDAAPAAPKLDPSMIQWDTAPDVPTIATVASEIPAQRREAGFLTRLGRGAASLADVTVGGVIPGAIEYGAYPLLRATGRSPKDAAFAAQSAASMVSEPFGKAFGVTGTPEYQSEATRQVMQFVAENFNKGAKWLSEKTGLPTEDVQNMMVTVTPVVTKGVAKAVPEAIDLTKAGVSKAGEIAKIPFAKQIEAKRQKLSADSYARGPQIDAALEAKRLGIALNPTDIDPKSTKAQISSMVAGPSGAVAIEKANLPKINQIARKEMGLPEGTSLAGAKAFNEARAAVAAPYDKIRQIPVIQGDDLTRKTLNDLRLDESLIGGEATAKSINKLIDSAVEKVDAGLSGKTLLENISNLRSASKRIYNNPNASPKQIAVADANLKIANTLEGMIETSIFEPRLLSDFRTARQQMARIYGYELATDFNTGMVNPSKLAKVTSVDNAMTGDIAALGRIAGNFPSAFKSTPEQPWYGAPRLTRSGVGGATGALLGSSFGLTGSILGGAVGAGVGNISSGIAAKRIASPGFQNKLRVPDYRIPMANRMAVESVPTQNLPAVFDPVNALVQPTDIVGYASDGTPITAAQAFSRPNWTPGRQGAQVTPIMPETPLALPAPNPATQINALRAEDTRRAAVSRSIGRDAEARQAAAEAASRRPTSGEVVLDIDPVTGRIREASQGVKGATPETFRNFGEGLQSAAQKVAAGRSFDMTAAEKVAWNKTKVDLAEVAPGFKALTDKAITDKMLDRRWVADAITKAQEKAQAFQNIADRATTDQARRAAMANRERMMDLMETLEEQIASARPVAGKSQGPKTREFNRNRLTGQSENQNALVR